MRACNQALQNEKWTGAVNAEPHNKTGIVKYCPLSTLHMFDIIWDVMLDMMHTIKNFWEARVIPTFKGTRCPARSTASEPSKTDKNYRDRLKEFRRAGEAYANLRAAHDLCTFEQKNMDLVDKRVKSLCGEPDWINNTMVKTNTHSHVLFSTLLNIIMSLVFVYTQNVTLLYCYITIR